jgi:hypothetical protein
VTAPPSGAAAALGAGLAAAVALALLGAVLARRRRRRGTVYACVADHMQRLEWLEGIFGTVRCANCGAVYGRDDVSVVGNRDEYWFVRCSCHSCGTQGIGVVIVKEVTAEVAVPAGAPPFQVDDVIAAHEALRDYAGDVHGLFEGAPGT